MNKEKIQEKFLSIVINHFHEDRDEINLNTDFKKDLTADSLDMVELIMECEDEFNISIPDEEAEKIQTVQDGINYLCKTLAA